MESKDGRKPGETAAIIGGGVVITGDVSCEGELQIGGKVIGDVRCATLFVDEGGVIKGDVQAERLRLSGMVDGTIDTRDLAIESTGHAVGTATYERLKVNAGGVIDGTLQHRATEQRRSAAIEPEHKVIDLDAAKPRRVYVD